MWNRNSYLSSVKDSICVRPENLKNVMPGNKAKMKESLAVRAPAPKTRPKPKPKENALSQLRVMYPDSSGESSSEMSDNEVEGWDKTVEPGKVKNSEDQSKLQNLKNSEKSVGMLLSQLRRENKSKQHEFKIPHDKGHSRAHKDVLSNMQQDNSNHWLHQSDDHASIKQELEYAGIKQELGITRTQDHAGIKQELGITKIQDYAGFTQELGITRKQDISGIKQELGITRTQDHAGTKQELGIANTQSDDGTKQELGITRTQDHAGTKQELGIANTQSDDGTKQELGIANTQSDDGIKQELGIAKTQNHAGIKQELGITRTHDHAGTKQELGITKTLDYAGIKHELGIAKKQDHAGLKQEMGIAETQDHTSIKQELGTTRTKDHAGIKKELGKTNTQNYAGIKQELGITRKQDNAGIKQELGITRTQDYAGIKKELGITNTQYYAGIKQELGITRKQDNAGIKQELGNANTKSDAGIKQELRITRTQDNTGIKQELGITKTQDHAGIKQELGITKTQDHTGINQELGITTTQDHTGIKQKLGINPALATRNEKTGPGISVGRSWQAAGQHISIQVPNEKKEMPDRVNTKCSQTHQGTSSVSQMEINDEKGKDEIYDPSPTCGYSVSEDKEAESIEHDHEFVTGPKQSQVKASSQVKFEEDGNNNKDDLLETVGEMAYVAQEDQGVSECNEKQTVIEVPHSETISESDRVNHQAVEGNKTTKEGTFTMSTEPANWSPPISSEVTGNVPVEDCQYVCAKQQAGLLAKCFKITKEVQDVNEVSKESVPGTDTINMVNNHLQEVKEGFIENPAVCDDASKSSGDLISHEVLPDKKQWDQEKDTDILFQCESDRFDHSQNSSSSDHYSDHSEISSKVTLSLSEPIVDKMESPSNDQKVEFERQEKNQVGDDLKSTDVNNEALLDSDSVCLDFTEECLDESGSRQPSPEIPQRMYSPDCIDDTCLQSNLVPEQIGKSLEEANDDFHLKLPENSCLKTCQRGDKLSMQDIDQEESKGRVPFSYLHLEAEKQSSPEKMNESDGTFGIDQRREIISGESTGLVVTFSNENALVDSYVSSQFGHDMILDLAKESSDLSGSPNNQSKAHSVTSLMKDFKQSTSDRFDDLREPFALQLKEKEDEGCNTGNTGKADTDQGDVDLLSVTSGALDIPVINTVLEDSDESMGCSLSGLSDALDLEFGSTSPSPVIMKDHNTSQSSVGIVNSLCDVKAKESTDAAVVDTNDGIKLDVKQEVYSETGSTPEHDLGELQELQEEPQGNACLGDEAPENEDALSLVCDTEDLMSNLEDLLQDENLQQTKQSPEKDETKSVDDSGNSTSTKDMSVESSKKRCSSSSRELPSSPQRSRTMSRTTTSRSEDKSQRDSKPEYKVSIHSRNENSRYVFKSQEAHRAVKERSPRRALGPNRNRSSHKPQSASERLASKPLSASELLANKPLSASERLALQQRLGAQNAANMSSNLALQQLIRNGPVIQPSEILQQQLQQKQQLQQQKQQLQQQQQQLQQQQQELQRRLQQQLPPALQLRLGLMQNNSGLQPTQNVSDDVAMICQRQKVMVERLIQLYQQQRESDVVMEKQKDIIRHYQRAFLIAKKGGPLSMQQVAEDTTSRQRSTPRSKSPPRTESNPDRKIGKKWPTCDRREEYRYEDQSEAKRVKVYHGNREMSEHSYERSSRSPDKEQPQRRVEQRIIKPRGIPVRSRLGFVNDHDEGRQPRNLRLPSDEQMLISVPNKRPDDEMNHDRRCIQQKSTPLYSGTRDRPDPRCDDVVFEPIQDFHAEQRVGHPRAMSVRNEVPRGMSPVTIVEEYGDYNMNSRNPHMLHEGFPHERSPGLPGPPCLEERTSPVSPCQGRTPSPHIHSQWESCRITERDARTGVVIDYFHSSVSQEHPHIPQVVRADRPAMHEPPPFRDGRHACRSPLDQHPSECFPEDISQGTCRGPESHDRPHCHGSCRAPLRPVFERACRTPPHPAPADIHGNYRPPMHTIHMNNGPVFRVPSPTPVIPSQGCFRSPRHLAMASHQGAFRSFVRPPVVAAYPNVVPQNFEVALPQSSPTPGPGLLDPHMQFRVGYRQECGYQDESGQYADFGS
ncbi:uncharacterized protein LOC121424704 [Lytechinus variegatus]|uniref:uncharacterized protein LOC121424704 n=1 Tax=Lytechinus variegatus TaxID=7654 RepID=UPI001BB14BFA|nr:uncharacterized protein LOC121424704 [Lytechinus variegatus]